MAEPSIKNITTRVSREMTSQKISKFGERGEHCQALACGGARYFPSLIALLEIVIKARFFIDYMHMGVWKMLSLIGTVTTLGIISLNNAN